jgi:hypothetical protein
VSKRLTCAVSPLQCETHPWCGLLFLLIQVKCKTHLPHPFANRDEA